MVGDLTLGATLLAALDPDTSFVFLPDRLEVVGRPLSEQHVTGRAAPLSAAGIRIVGRNQPALTLNPLGPPGERATTTITRTATTVSVSCPVQQSGGRRPALSATLQSK